MQNRIWILSRIIKLETARYILLLLSNIVTKTNDLRILIIVSVGY